MESKMISPEQLRELREAYKADNFYMSQVSSQARVVLEEIIEHPRFPGSTDPAVLTMLGTLLHIIQPRRVLQLGTYIGFSSVFIADILARNSNPGTLVTVDPDTSAHELAASWLASAGLRDRVTMLNGYSTDSTVNTGLQPYLPFDLVYLDSSHAYQATLEELDRIFESGKWLSEHGLLLLHDAAEYAACWDPSGAGGVGRALNEWIEDHTETHQLMILEPPLWPGVCGLGLLARRNQSERGSRIRDAQHVEQLQTAIAQKDEHIARLETLLAEIQAGRMMRILRLYHKLIQKLKT
jgi:predicted O-methyltransferase YrrM